jgi:thiol-disulfide isomerase/thioredoxin
MNPRGLFSALLLMFVAFCPLVHAQINQVPKNVIISGKVLNAEKGKETGDKQLLKKLYHVLDRLENFGCVVTYKMLDEDADTSEQRASCQYFKNEKDTLIGYSFVISATPIHREIYDGDYLLFLQDESRHYNITNDSEGLRRNLSSFWCSPLSIKRLLKTCLSSDSVNYRLERDSNKNYRLKMVLPFFNLDGYLPLDIPTMPGQKTEYEIIFDKASLLPVYQYRNNVGVMKFTARFERIEKLSNQKIVALDSIPSGYRTDVDKSIENDFKDSVAPGFKLQQFQGDSIDLYQTESEFTLLEFTSLNCGPCRSAAKFLKENYDSSRNQRLSILMIDDELKTNIKSLTVYIRDSKLPFPYLVNGLDVSKNYKVPAVPTFFLLDKNKRILEVKIGYDEQWLNELLEKTICIENETR